jgi:hypothetical protein
LEMLSTAFSTTNSVLPRYRKPNHRARIVDTDGDSILFPQLNSALATLKSRDVQLSPKSPTTDEAMLIWAENSALKRLLIE